jgi:hypothetical protein
VSSNWPSGHSKILSAEERSLRASLGVNTSWANTADRPARTKPARDAFFAKFCHEVDPDGVLPEDERIRRAEYLMKAHMQRMSLAASKARRLRRQIKRQQEEAAGNGPSQ